MNLDGVVVVLSYPDTVVRPAYEEFSSKIWPLLGIGGKNGVQAGHAALLLIHKKKGSIDYYDFGRYITSLGNGRVRSKQTDADLAVPIKANFVDGKMTNIDEVLLWLDRHPNKTHGKGRLVLSLNTKIDYQKALSFINTLISQKEIPYGAFLKNGSNCARFVTDVLLNSCADASVLRKLKTSYLLTPSPIGNAIKASTEKDMYWVCHQKIKNYSNRSVLKEYKTCFFNKVNQKINLLGTELPNKQVFDLQNATWLGGIGAGAWFKIEQQINDRLYKISRYTALGLKDFQGVFSVEDKDFDFKKHYKITYPTNCMEVFVEQNEMTFKFRKHN